MSALTAEQALIRASDTGVQQVPLPTPFAVGRVNCYLIDDEPLTLVDTGPNSDRALEELERQLAEHGRKLEEIELILVTHNHIDHIGLVEAVVGRSRAEVAALGIGAERMANFDRDAEREDEFAVGLMLRHGVPESIAMPLRDVSRSFRTFGAPARVTRPLDDGDAIELGRRTLQVLHRPGHSPMDTVYWDETNGYALCGDHLLAHISSNPLLTRPLDETTERTQALVSYLESLRRTAATPASYLLPGHGEAITDHPALIHSRLEGHERRKRKIHALIAERPRSAYEVAQALWGNVAVTQAFLCLSEVIGHTDLLVNEGSVREVSGPDSVRFEAVDGAEVDDDGADAAAGSRAAAKEAGSR